MKRRNFLLSLSAATLIPCIPASKPDLWRGLVGKWSPHNVMRPDDTPLIEINFKDHLQQICYNDTSFIMGWGNTVFISSKTHIKYGYSIPLSKKEWGVSDAEFVEQVKRQNPKCCHEFFEITYRDLSNIWAKITPRDSVGGSRGD